MKAVVNKSVSEKVPHEFIKSFFMICHSGSFNMYKEFGAHWCRADFSWEVVEPSVKVRLTLPGLMICF